MATATVPLTTEAALESDVQPFDVTSEVFFQMIEAGVFPPKRRVFLWGGRLYEKMAKTVAHALTAYTIQEKLRPLIAPYWLIWPENPIPLDERHAPLPDVTVVRGPFEVYKQERRHPRVEDVGLIVEIAVSSLTQDLTVRAGKFARARVPNYWVVDVDGRRLVEHTDPQIVDGVGRYAKVEAHQRGQDVRLVLDGRELALIPVAELIWW
jgi:Uma2 family endonuclease